MASLVSNLYKRKKVAIVFVHLGKNPSPNLYASAKYAQLTNPIARIILLTNHSEDWNNFPGEVFQLSNSLKKQSRHLVKKAGYLRKIAGGYWVNTYERIFALRELENILDPETFVIHIESDVIIQSQHILEGAIGDLTVQGIGVPRMNAEQGIASILISENYMELNNSLTLLEILSIKYPEKCTTDMNLLGLALNLNIISELPTWKDEGSLLEPQENYYLFEGAAVGQYLFGLDPIHNGNMRKSGHENPSFPIQLSTLKWDIEQNSIYATDGKSKYWFTNLHIHSKEELLTPIEDPERWIQVMAEANLEAPRATTGVVLEAIHSRGYSTLVKLEIVIRTKMMSRFPKNQKNQS
jgi:hypothetical protein